MKLVKLVVLLACVALASSREVRNLRAGQDKCSAIKKCDQYKPKCCQSSEGNKNGAECIKSDDECRGKVHVAALDNVAPSVAQAAATATKRCGASW